MKIQRILTGIVLACGIAGTAQAASLMASGPVYGGPSQHHVACQVFNAGTSAITFVRTEIYNQFDAGAIALSFNNCGGALAPGDVCTFQAAAINQAYACKVVINEAKTNVRGTMTALSAVNAALSEADLR